MFTYASLHIVDNYVNIRLTNIYGSLIDCFSSFSVLRSLVKKIFSVLNVISSRLSQIGGVTSQ